METILEKILKWKSKNKVEKIMLKLNYFKTALLHKTRMSLATQFYLITKNSNE